MKIYLFSVAFCLFFLSCDKKTAVEKAVTEIPLEIKIERFDKIFFETGPVMLTIAYYKSIDISRSSGKTDVILPPKMLYNYDYARATTPEYVTDDSCYYSSSKTSEEKLQLVHNFHGIEIETLGGDMFSGSWATNLLKPINYDQPNFYLELGNQSTEYYFGEI